MILDMIQEWFKELLIDGIISNLTGMFDTLNTKVGEIAGEVGMTPAAWNSSIFNMIRNLSETVIVPIAGIILTFVMCYELIQLIIEKNNLHDFDTWIFFKWIFKPFSSKILLCKIAAILRRGGTENKHQSLLIYKELSMDIEGFHVYHKGSEVVLTSKEFALLRLMLENQGKVFTRQMLLDRLWDDDAFVEDRIVDSHIKNIRKKLDDDYIETIRGVGYRIDKEH